MNTYKFNIHPVEAYVSKDGLENLIFNLHWQYTATSEDGQHTATSIGTQQLEHDPNSEFISIAELKANPSIVYGWLEEALGAERIAELQSNLDKQIEEKMNPTTVVLNLQSDSSI